MIESLETIAPRQILIGYNFDKPIPKPLDELPPYKVEKQSSENCVLEIDTILFSQPAIDPEDDLLEL